MNKLTYKDIKPQVKRLKDFLKEKEIILKLGHCYEAVSVMYGYPNWDTFSAHLKKNEQLLGNSE